MDQPWKTDKWFTSPWCYLPEVRNSVLAVPQIQPFVDRRSISGCCNSLQRLIPRNACKMYAHKE